MMQVLKITKKGPQFEIGSSNAIILPKRIVRRHYKDTLRVKLNGAWFKLCNEEESAIADYMAKQADK
jgi:hypothetical protein